MRLFNIIIIVFTILAASCSKDDVNSKIKNSSGTYIALPYKWKKSIHSKEAVSNGRIDSPIYYENNICLPTTDGDKKQLFTMVNINNGETVWSWDDRFDPEYENIYLSYYCQKNEFVAYTYGYRIYCINLETGKTQWKIKQKNNINSRVNTYNGLFFFSYEENTNEDGKQEIYAHKYNMITGKKDIFLRANLSREYESPNGIGGISYVTEIKKDENRVLVTYGEPLPEWKINSFFGLYNIKTESWEWDRKLLAPPLWNTSVPTPPIIYEEKVYATVGKSIVCHELATGKQIWKRDFPQDFLFSGFIIEEDKIIANCEDTYTYCLNPEYGTIIWKTESAGTCGLMSYLNGIVYFKGGSTGNLHAIDIATGEMVWSLEEERFDGENFKRNGIYVFEATEDEPAKVIALTHLNAYCFEAYR